MRITRTTRLLAPLLVTLLALAGCQGGQGKAADSASPRAGIKIIMVTHGQAGDPYWSVVKRGVEPFGEQPSVGEPGERVVGRLVAQLILLLAQPGDAGCGQAASVTHDGALPTAERKPAARTIVKRVVRTASVSHGWSLPCLIACSPVEI